jgi:hypothetical protein
LNNTQSFLIQVLSDYLNRRETSQASVDWNELFFLADKHEIGGIVYKQCERFIPAPYKAALEQKFGTELYQYQNRLRLFNQISRAFSDNHIPFFTVKGFAVSDLYPVCSLRTMGDCDLVIHTADKKNAHDLMLGLGFECTRQESHEWLYFKNGFKFEIHDHLLYKEKGAVQSWVEFMDTMWDFFDGSSLDWSFHYIFLLLHLEKHLTKRGVGFRQFMDLYVVKNSIVLNWTWINQKLNELGLRSFSDRVLMLINYWFGEQSITSKNEREFLESATETIIRNGIFGFDNVSNNKNKVTRKVIRSRKSSLLFSIEHLFSLVFLPYAKLRTIKAYSFIEGRPWLLPVAWIYRVYRTVRYKNKNYISGVLEKSVVTDKEVEARKKELAMWGLY